MLVTGVTEGTLWSHVCDGTGYSAVRTRATLTLHTITIIPNHTQTGIYKYAQCQVAKLLYNFPQNKIILTRKINGAKKHASCHSWLVSMAFTMNEMVLHVTAIKGGCFLVCFRFEIKLTKLKKL